jgi:hypothetical protein
MKEYDENYRISISIRDNKNWTILRNFNHRCGLSPQMFSPANQGAGVGYPWLTVLRKDLADGCTGEKARR